MDIFAAPFCLLYQAVLTIQLNYNNTYYRLWYGPMGYTYHLVFTARTSATPSASSSSLSTSSVSYTCPSGPSLGQGLLCVALLFFLDLLGCDLLCFDLICFTLLGFSFLPFPSLYFVLLCFVLLSLSFLPLYPPPFPLNYYVCHTFHFSLFNEP